MIRRTRRPTLFPYTTLFRSEALAGDEGNAGNVVDRLLGIELGALPADLVEDVDQMHLHVEQAQFEHGEQSAGDRKSTRLNSSHGYISYAVFCLKKKKPCSST